MEADFTTLYGIIVMQLFGEHLALLDIYMWP